MALEQGKTSQRSKLAWNNAISGFDWLCNIVPCPALWQQNQLLFSITELKFKFTNSTIWSHGLVTQTGCINEPLWVQQGYLLQCTCRGFSHRWIGQHAYLKGWNVFCWEGYT